MIIIYNPELYKNNVYTVYMHVFPNDKVYIGITCKDVNRRWNTDGSGYKNQIKMWRAIQKYGWDNIEHIIIAKNINIESAVHMEQELIELYDSTNKKHGYNTSLGGWAHSNEVKEKISSGNLGKKHTEEAKKKMSESRKGVPKTEEWKRKIGQAHLGIKHTDEARKRMSEIAKNRVYDSTNDRRNIAVVQLNLETKEFINEYRSVKEASRQTETKAGHISECCKNKRRQEGGFSWMYKSDYIINH